MLVGIAIDEKAIEGIDATLGKYATELRGAPYGAVQFRHALTMSSGIRFTEDYENPFADIHTMFVRLYLLGDTGESAGHYLASRPREREAGRVFSYESSDTFAIGLSLRGAVHQSLSEYLERKVWQPLGMEYDATWNVDGSGMELSFCCLNVRLRDYAKLGRLFARGGDWDGQRIVSEAWVHQSTRPDATYPPGSIPWTPYGYQYQWWIPPGSHGAFMAIGVWGQNLYVNPATGVVIVKTSVDPDFATTEEEHAAVFEAIDRAVSSPG
jgi:CubicO group peptidase (beta-lactamase class C family)